jgi:CHAT domain-containing protein
MRRWALLLVLFGAASCSRRPSLEETYTEAWSAFQQGKLAHAQDIISLAVDRRGNQASDDAFVKLELLHTEILLGRRQTDEAWKILSRLPALSDPALHLRWLVDRADALLKMRHGDQAEALLDEADRTLDADVDSKFKALIMRGQMLAREGSFDRADALLEQTAASAAASADLFYQAAALLNLSFSKKQQGRYDESAEYGLLALETAKQAHASQLQALAGNNLGIAYGVLRDLDRAEQYLNPAIQELREIGDLGNLEDALGELGNTHLLGNQPGRAAGDYEQAIEVAKRVNTPDAARWAGQLALAFIEQRNWSEAESWNRQAYSFLGKASDPYLRLNEAAIATGRGRVEEAVRLYRELIAESAKVPYLEWNAHVRLASLFASQRQFPEANNEYERGLEVIDAVRSSLLRDDSRLTYYNLQIQFFKDYVDLLVSEGREDKALQVAEYSRARVLAEKLGLQPGSIEQVRLDNFQKYARRTGQIVLSFWLASRRSFVWVIRPDGIRMKELPGESQIADMVRIYRHAIEDELRDPVAERMVQGERLSEMLLGPVREQMAGARRVVVVSDGPLHALNLETLPAADGSHYWIEDVELSMAPSLSVLADRRPDVRPVPVRTRSSLLLIGAPQSATPQYPELRSARAEIESIARRFANQEQFLRVGYQATPRAFLDSMPERFSIIHFAAHAETNAQRPLESAVILSRSGDSYKLYARDIAGLKLSASLVTISACRSAGARAYGGEGLVGFAWAFLEAGAHSVIAGLWDVGDQTSSALMDKLYDGISSGMSPAAALRQAKRALLHSKGSSRIPFYWAPYQVYIS